MGKIIQKDIRDLWVRGKLHYEQRGPEDSRSKSGEGDDPTYEELTKQDLPRVLIVTSALNGTPVQELEDNARMMVRLKGPIVEILPDDKREERRENVSKPYEARLVHKKLVEQEGDDASEAGMDQWELIIDLPEGGYARGTVSELEKVVQPSNMEENDDDFSSGDRTVKLAMVGVLVLSILGVLITFLLI
jgi:hypothetical protein